MALWALGNAPLGPFSEEELTDPADGAVVADTGALDETGNYDVIVTVGASAAADFALQRRNAANDANVGDAVVLKAAAGQSGQYRFRYRLEDGQRLRVVMDDALTGTAAVAINLEKLK